MFDLLILGGGPAGYCAAERAAAGGFKVALFEKRSLGGVCLNEGCIPSKALLNSAKLYYSALHGEEYGVKVEGATLNHEKVIARKGRVVKTLVAGVAAKMKHAGVTVVNGTALIAGREPDGSFKLTVGNEAYQGRRLLIATGSEPVVPPIPGLKDALAAGFAMTNREILDLTKVPERFAIIGGGVIGLEMANYYAVAGSKVTVVEMLDHIAGQTDREIASLLQKELSGKGITFHLEAKVVEVGKDSVTFEQKGQKTSVPCDAVLLSIGRRPVTQGFGLENLGLALERGAVVCDEHGRTSVAGVWAAGDVNGRSMLAHTAYREAEVAVHDMLGQRDTMRYHAIPGVIYTYPEVASVGMTEADAAAAGMEVLCANLSLRYAGRYVAEVEKGTGIAKAVVDKASRRLLGVHILGSYASEIIYGAAAMIECELRVEDIREIVFPHPTVSEIIREAMFEIR